jgi:hypothetical protein
VIPLRKTVITAAVAAVTLLAGCAGHQGPDVRDTHAANTCKELAFGTMLAENGGDFFEFAGATMRAEGFAKVAGWYRPQFRRDLWVVLVPPGHKYPALYNPPSAFVDTLKADCKKVAPKAGKIWPHDEQDYSY